MSLGKTHTDKIDDFSYPDDIKVSWMPKSKGVLTWPVSETRFQMNGPRKKKDTSLRFRDPNGNLIMYPSNVKYYCSGFCLNSACDF